MAEMIKLSGTDLKIFPMCFGGNIFGWTTDKDESFAVLDSFVEVGGNFIDTSDSYSAWAPGNVGGESQTILGEWLRQRHNRDNIIIGTKIGRKPDRLGLTRANIRISVDESLDRMGIENLDVLYTHFDDQAVPFEETLSELDRIVKQGKARYIGASNYTAPRLAQALDIQKREHLASYIMLQPPYNLLRRDYEDGLQSICVDRAISVVPCFSLASGVLTGKYRQEASADGVKRETYVRRFLKNPKTEEILDALAAVAANHNVSMAAASLAWLMAQPGIVAPITSARTSSQLADLLPMIGLELTAAELASLDEASRPGAE